MTESALMKALIAARAEIKATVFKSAMNEHQRYAYVGHEAVMTSGAREAMLKHGLVLLQTSLEFVNKMEYGKGSTMLLWKGVYRLVHTSGESQQIEAMATTVANDKAAYVASTALDRTVHLRTLALTGSSTDDPENEVHEQRAQNQGQHPPKAIDPFVQHLMEKLYQATPETLPQLVSEANMIRQSMAPEEKVAMRTAVEFARAKVARMEEENEVKESN